MLREVGDEQEQAAATLGAGALADLLAHHAAVDPLGRRLRRRADDGAGDRRVRRRQRRVAARSPAQTETLTLLVEKRFQNFDLAGAYAASALLAVIALATLLAMTLLKPRKETSMIRVQRRHEALRRLRGPRRRVGGRARRLADRAARAQRLGQVDAAARSSPGSRRPTPAASCIDGDDVDPGAAAAARDRVRLPALRGVQAHDRARQRRLRPEDPQAAARPRSTRASTSCWASSACRATTSATRRSSPAASASAWRWPARSPSSRACCCSTSRSARCDANVRAELRSWLRRLHDEVPVTTVLVTHDQEEAMEVADRVVVMNARAHRAGRRAARALRRAGQRVRHGLPRAGRASSAERSCARTTSASRPTPSAGAQEAQVVRVVHLGFEVRVELELGDGSRLPVQLDAPRGRGARARPRATSSGSAARRPSSRRPSRCVG